MLESLCLLVVWVDVNVFGKFIFFYSGLMIKEVWLLDVIKVMIVSGEDVCVINNS